MSAHNAIIWTPAMLDALVTGRGRGERLVMLAKRIGVGFGTVCAKAKELGLDAEGTASVQANDFWTVDRIAVLRAEWAKGTSTRTIAKLIGTTNNAVVGKRRRLGLPERPSPIKGAQLSEKKPRKSRAKYQHPIKFAQPRLAALGAASRSRQAHEIVESEGTEVASALQEFKRPRGTQAVASTLNVAASIARIHVAVAGPVSKCCWPMWNDTERAPRPPIFCDATTKPGRTYCAQHFSIAYRQAQAADAA